MGTGANLEVGSQYELLAISRVVTHVLSEKGCLESLVHCLICSRGEPIWIQLRLACT